MTLLVGWVAVDQRSIASVYIACDSRFTWPTTKPYDYGRKVFAFKRTPDLVAYCGDVLFPSIALARAVEIADHGLLFKENSTCDQRKEALLSHLKQHFSSYPTSALGGNIDIFHFSRDIDNSFHAFHYHTSETLNWSSNELPINDKLSNIVITAGIGKEDYLGLYYKYGYGISSNTSRSIFQCFCDCLLNHTPVLCGGAPQLIGLYRAANSAPERIRNGIDFGIIVNQKRYFLGAELDRLDNYDKIRWYNEFFEISDGKTMQRDENSMPQPNPFLNSATP